MSRALVKALAEILKRDVCTLDNPQTMRRELWHNGEVISFITVELLLGVELVNPWCPGQVIGEPNCLLSEDDY